MYCVALTSKFNSLSCCTCPTHTHPPYLHHDFSPPDDAVVDTMHCFESPPGGLMATVTGHQPEGVVIWDADAPCEQQEEQDDLSVTSSRTTMAYIHYAGVGDVIPMTAGAGPVLHTYRAAFFDALPVPEGASGCHPFHIMFQDYCKTEWRVARYGATCDIENILSDRSVGGQRL